MQTKFVLFKNEFIEAIKNDVYSVLEFGSSIGEQHPDISDIDILIIASDTKRIPRIFSVARSLERKHLGISHLPSCDFLEKRLLFSNDFTGVHLLILSRDELDSQFQPKSLRLKILTTLLIGRTLFIYNIKHHHRLLFGVDISKKVKTPALTFFDRISAFTFPAFVLLALALPLAILDKHKFKIWCFKALKYHREILLSYVKLYLDNNNLDIHDLKLHWSLLDMAEKYRYSQNSYRGTRLALYLKSWGCLVSNLPFLWQGPKLL